MTSNLPWRQIVVHDEAHERLSVHDEALARRLWRKGRFRFRQPGWGSSPDRRLVIVGVDEHGIKRGSVLLACADHLLAAHLLLGLLGNLHGRDRARCAHAIGGAFARCLPSCPRTSKESPLRLLYRTRPARVGCLAGAAPCVASCAGRASCVHQRFAPARPWLPCVPAYDYAMLHLAINPLPSRHPLRNRHYSEEREPSRKEGAKMGQAALSPRAAHGAVEGGRRQARCTARRERAMPRGMAARRAREAGPTALRAAWTGGFTWPCDPLPE